MKPTRPAPAPTSPATSSLVLSGRAVSRRRFLAAAGGLAAFSATACSGPSRSSRPVALPDEPAPAAPSASPGGSVTTTSVPPGVAGDRVLVVVSLDGGNDAVNTLTPDLGSVHDLRPGLALSADDLLRHDTLPGHGLHPALAPMLPWFDAGQVAVLAGVGFPDPDRSHFTSTDRWNRADRMEAGYGWLGRWIDTLDPAPTALGATSLGSTGDLLVGATRRGSAIADVDAFGFPAGLSHGDVRALAAADATDDLLVAAARAAFAASVGAVEEFDEIADAVREQEREPDAPSGPFANGLAVAAELIRSGPETRVVSVTAGGFDTHSRQLDQHASLLADLATGLAEFWSTLEASDDAERVVLMTTSEFGRRVAENGSAGCDHGSAGVAFVMGPSVVGGLAGTIDTDQLVDGDLVPLLDPRTMFTAGLDWLGGDPEIVLGRRWDEVPLLRV